MPFKESVCWNHKDQPILFLFHKHKKKTLQQRASKKKQYPGVESFYYFKQSH